jgi:6-phosphogluconolactonase
LIAGTDLYATSIAGITGFTIASDGSLSTVPGSPFSSATIGGAVLVQSNTTPVNYFLYASDFADPSGTVSAFTVDPTTGILSTVPGSFTTGAFSAPEGIVFAGSSAGLFVFVALNTADQIAAFSVDPNSGVLTPVVGSPFPGGVAPESLALNPSQNVLYALSFFGGTISAYSIASDGTLSAINGSPFTVGVTPGSMTVAQDNFMYVSLPAADSILGFSIDSGGGLAPLVGSPFPATGAGVLAVVQIPPS